MQNAATMILSLLRVGRSMYQALPGSPSTRSSGTNTWSKCTEHEPIERIPSFGSGVILTPGRLRGDPEQTHALVALGHILSVRASTNR